MYKQGYKNNFKDVLTILTWIFPACEDPFCGGLFFPLYSSVRPLFPPLGWHFYSCDLIQSIGKGSKIYFSHGTRVISFVYSQFNQNNYTNDLWTHYLIYFIRLSGSYQLHGQIIYTCFWLEHFSTELCLRRKHRMNRSKVNIYHSNCTLYQLACFYVNALHGQQKLLVTFTVKPCRREEEL